MRRGSCFASGRAGSADVGAVLVTVLSAGVSAVLPDGLPAGVGAGGRPVRVAAATATPAYASSVTSARSTSRTPNQASEMARAVAPHQTARYPRTRRMR
ncbi:hypothetical protein [Thermocatellispora tengchongensis]|uniref:hypothetical protein n=1 Tax=Thermocatellispora tengchongensis TaxID=1073253 RepID=UPI00363B671E